MGEMEIDAVVATLQANQRAMAEDVGEIKTAIKSIAETLRKIETIEERQISQGDAIKRAHERLDLHQAVCKDEFKGHERRIQNVELHNAKTVWIERLVSAAVLAVIGLWIKGGL